MKSAKSSKRRPRRFRVFSHSELISLIILVSLLWNIFLPEFLLSVISTITDLRNMLNIYAGAFLRKHFIPPLPILAKTFQHRYLTMFYIGLNTIFNNFFSKYIVRNHGFQPSDCLPINETMIPWEIFQRNLSTHFWPMFLFYTPWKHQETFSLVVFFGWRNKH